MIIVTDKSKCCGCTACMSACLKRCIKMDPDEEGFLYPKVDLETCTNCGVCEKVCPILNPGEVSLGNPVSFTIQNKNDIVLKASTSGGFFQTLCDYTIHQNGYVVGVEFDEQFKVVHKIAETMDESKNFMGSKYVQSDLTDIFCRVKKLLDKGRLVTFSGTPCQVAGLKSCLRKDYHNLITVDLVCRSVPSPKLWSKYLDYQRNRYHSEVKSIQCRSKRYGYHNGSLVIQFTNGKQYSGSNRVDLYGKAFHHDVCSRPSCYNCKFKTVSRCSDFTIFDCWHPELLAKGLHDNNKGYTNVLIHSAKGLKIFETKLKIAFASFQTDVKEVLKFTGEMAEKPIAMLEARKYFYEILEEKPFQETMQQFVTVSAKDKLVEGLKPILYKIGILDKRSKR